MQRSRFSNDNRRRLSALVLVLTSAISVACDDEGGGGGVTVPPLPNNGSPDLAAFFAVEPYANLNCNRLDTELTGRREVNLFATPTLQVARYSRALQRYYRRHGLTFFTTRMVSNVEQPFAINTDEAALNNAILAAFPNDDLSDDALKMNPELYKRVLKFAVNFMFRPVIDFAMKNNHGPGVTNIVMVPRILPSNGTSPLPEGAMIVGLAISRALIQEFQRSGSMEGEIWKDIDLPAEFSPMMFLDGTFLGQYAVAGSPLVDLTTAHEFGHTGALIHLETDKRNLMYPSLMPGVNDCTDGLKADQLALLRKTIGVGVGAPLAREISLPASKPTRSRLSELFPAPRLKALLRGDADAVAELVKLAD